MDGDYFACNFCPFRTSLFSLFQSHYVRRHRNEPNFFIACCIDSCSYTTKRWGAFRVHVHRKHKHIIEEDDVAVHEDDSGGRGDAVDNVTHQSQDISYSNAMYTLSLETQHKMTKTAIDAVVESTSLLLNSHLDHYRTQLKDKLAERGIDASIVDGIKIDMLLENMNSDAKRQAFYQNTMTCYVSPKDVVLGQNFVTKNGKITEVSRVGYIVPFEKNVSNMLSMPEVWHCVQNAHFSDSHFMWDICDGDFVKNHPLFNSNPKALQVILSCDDLEIVNPLGSHVKKHKVTIFYFTLSNILPEYRSRLNVTQLLALARTKDIRQNNAVNLLLKDFVTTMNQLANGGINLTLHGDQHTIEGALVMVAADTLAANWLGQFKEGVSFALKNCRRCEVESATASNVYVASQVPLRTNESHRERCDQLSAGLSTASKQYWSKLWGINGRSVLMDIDGFSIVDGLVQDPMHVLLEGTVPYELSQLLFNLIYVQKLFTLRWLNTAIRGFPYSYLHTKTRPEPIEKHHIDGKSTIKQTASAMLTLCQTLPVILGPKVPQDDEHWVQYLHLMQIVHLCTSPYCTSETAAMLEVLIAQYLRNFKVLYPKQSFIPKMHFMVHFPRQMLRYGPIRHHWCMRFEGKNGFFTQYRYKNFKNLPLSLAKRHQLHMCYVQSGADGERSVNYLYEGDTIQEGETIDLSERYPQLMDKAEFLGIVTSSVYSSSSANIHGHLYKKGCILVLEYDHDDPVFGVLKEIVVADHTKYFVVEKATSKYEHHILCYVLNKTAELDIFPQAKLTFKWPLCAYQYNGRCVVMNVRSHTCEML